MTKSITKITIGRSDKIDLPEMNLQEIDAKIARTGDHSHLVNQPLSCYFLNNRSTNLANFFSFSQKNLNWPKINP